MPQLGIVYRWKSELEQAARESRIEELSSAPGSSPDQARRIVELEEELADYQRKLGQVMLENDLLKKLHPELTTAEKCEWVHRNKETIGSVQKTCKMIGLNMSTFYYRPKVNRVQKERQDADLKSYVEQIQSQISGSGYRTVQVYLNNFYGVRVGERRLRRVMKKYSLLAKVKRAFKKTTDSNHSYRVYPNLVKGLRATGINQVWVSDLTYVRIENGFCYVAIILDLFSRKVVGWAISKQIDGELALNNFLRDGPWLMARVRFLLRFSHANL